MEQQFSPPPTYTNQFFKKDYLFNRLIKKTFERKLIYPQNVMDCLILFQTIQMKCSLILEDPFSSYKSKNPKVYPQNQSLKLFFKRFYLFIFREGKGGRKRERNISKWLPQVHPLLGTWPTTQACALTGNQTSDPLVRRLALNPLSHTS